MQNKNNNIHRSLFILRWKHMRRNKSEVLWRTFSILKTREILTQILKNILQRVVSVNVFLYARNNKTMNYFRRICLKAKGDLIDWRGHGYSFLWFETNYPHILFEENSHDHRSVLQQNIVRILVRNWTETRLHLLKKKLLSHHDNTPPIYFELFISNKLQTNRIIQTFQVIWTI